MARGQGVVIKLAGRVDADPVTGRLTASFRDNPQLPFSTLDFALKGGPRAPLVNPQACGTHVAETVVSSWAGHVVSGVAPFVVDRGCGGVGFDPVFEAGSVNPVGGAASAFAVTFGRGDLDRELRSVEVALPEGVTGVIRGVAVCPGVLADAGACGEESRVGSVRSAAGPGVAPFWLPGRVYLTEGYRGGAYGLSIVVPAVAGPFDLGTVVVRAAIFVDRRSARLRVVSDAMPRVLQGIVLHLRTVHVAIDRPGFMLNPTSCREQRVEGWIGAYGGGGAQRSSRFQVGDCRGLPIKPRMMLRVGARGLTRRFAITPLTVTLRQAPEEGNLRLARVTLPRYLASRPEVVNVRVSCSLEQYQAERCPMQVGTAVAVTPLLRRPLRGDVFLVRHPERRLPDMMVRLKGQGDARGIVIDLTGKITIGRDLLLTTSFDTVPDVPVSRFVIRLTSGRNGPIATNRSLCVRSTRRQRAQLVFRGQNGRLVQRQRKLRIRGCGRAATRRRAAGGRGAAGRRAGRRAGTTQAGGRRTSTTHTSRARR